MAIRTGRQFLDSLRDGRRLFIDGEAVADVTTDRRFAGAAETLAGLYDLQHDPELASGMTYAPAGGGGPGDIAGLSFLVPRSGDDLVRRRAMVKVWADATCGMYGRTPDYMNVMLAGFAAARDVFAEREPRFGDNVWAYYEHCRATDLSLTHTLLNPQVDRSKPVEAQEKDLAAKILRETDRGIVIRGARMVSTLCAFAHDLMVMPSTYLSNTEAAAPYAFGFSIPVATPGLRFICRPTVMHLGAGSPMDFPISSRFDEVDAMVIFDDVLVPWERVFIHRDVALCNALYARTGAMTQAMHQFTVKNLAKAEFMMGLGFAIAKSTGADQHLHVQGMLAELIQFTEFNRACLRASEVDAVPGPGGSVLPATMPLWTVRMMFAKQFLRMVEIIQTIGAGGLVAVPSFAELEGPVKADVETYFQAANADSRTRVKLFRLAFDAALSSFAGRQQLYERYYSGDPVRLAGTLYGMYDKQPHIDRVMGMLDELEKKQKAGPEGPAFRTDLR